jgi:signal transduction histidine kinase
MNYKKTTENIIDLIKKMKSRKEIQTYFRSGLDLAQKNQISYKSWSKDLDKFINELEEEDRINKLLKSYGVTKIDKRFESKTIVLLTMFLAALNEKEQLEDQLNQVTDSYDEVLALITHEFKNILTSIHGYNMMLEKHLSKEKDKAEYNKLMSSDRLTRQLFDMVDSLLKMSLGEKGLLEPEYKLIDFVQNILHPVIADIDDQLKKKKMTISTNMITDNSILECDENLIDIVMRNLLINAVKYGEPGTEIAVKISYNEGKFFVAVKNKCKHIPKDFCNEIFQKFKSKKIGSVKGGTGIGLYNVKNILRLHQGDISCKISSNREIEFSFDLPRRVV